MLEVVAALLREGDRFLICQRPEGKKRAHFWEFPGGKVEQGESLSQALVRECREELGILLSVGEEFCEVTYAYPDVSVHLTLLEAAVSNGQIQMLEHEALRWIRKEEIAQYAFCPADTPFLEKLANEEGGTGYLRLEQEKDWFAAENLTREAFWNKYKPGCDEHLILHAFRSQPDFVPELCCVIEDKGELLAHILYCRAPYCTDGGEKRELLMFGPISVLPSRQGEGLGSRIIRRTLEKAKRLGFGAVVITGSPEYYHRFGFVSGSARGIHYAGVPRGEEAPFFMVLELREGFLPKDEGEFHEPEGYSVSPEALELFEKQFPPKRKEKRPGQLI